MAWWTAACLAAVGIGAASCAASSAPYAASSKPSEAVSIAYLGAAGWAVDAGTHTLLVDPYFTRVDVEDRTRTLEPDSAAIERFSPKRAEVILVGHSHYDHLLDVPAIAARTRAFVVGSESTLRIARAAGTPDSRLHLARPNTTLTFGVFTVRALPSLHSLTGETFGPVAPDVRWPLSAEDYAEGSTLAYLVTVHGHSILFIGSANFDESSLRQLRPDVAVVATALREQVPDYSCRLLTALSKPALVLPNHFDAHWQPLTDRATPVEPGQWADLENFEHEVRSCSPQSRLVIPRAFEPIAL